MWSVSCVMELRQRYRCSVWFSFYMTHYTAHLTQGDQMAAIVQLKQEMQFNARLGGVLDALKSIAAQQFQLLERAFTAHTALSEALQGIAAGLETRQLAHPFMQANGPVVVIVVTSDTGLLGGLHQQVVSAALQMFQRHPGELFVIGERGRDAIQERGLTCAAFPAVQETAKASLAARVRDEALGAARAGRIGSLTIVYPRALSFTVQRVEQLQALPCTAWLRAGATQSTRRASQPTLCESSPAQVVEYLAWVWVQHALMEALDMSRLAELAARSSHLEGSSQELQRRGKKLLLRYFRERRELIDRNIRELFAAKALYGNN